MRSSPRAGSHASRPAMDPRSRTARRLSSTMRDDDLVHLRPAPRRRPGPRSPSCSASSSTAKRAAPTRCTSSATCSKPGSATTIRPTSAPYVAASLRALRRQRRAGVFHPRQPRFPARRATTRARAGMRILPDPAVVDAVGKPTLLMHGDLLCTDDVAYQQFRAQTRNPDWQAQFLAQPLAARLAFAQQARAASQAHQSGLREAGTMETITDVSPATVAATFARFGIDTMIHGHTHRPAMHELDVTAAPAGASCWATGTNRARCCAWMRDGCRLTIRSLRVGARSERRLLAVSWARDPRAVSRDPRRSTGIAQRDNSPAPRVLRRRSPPHCAPRG